MKYKKIIILLLICIFVGISGVIIYSKNKTQEISKDEQVQKEIDEMKENSTMYNEEASLVDLKEEYKYTGENDIYEVQTENDGRKVINIKPSVNYKVAFCGMIQNKMPNFENLDSEFEQNSPNHYGIWIKQDSHEKILNYLNNNKYLNSKYKINDEGYLEINKKNKQTDIDKQIESLINGDKQYVFCISSVCYMVDRVTGNIVDNPYNDFDEYQTYEYFEDKDRMIIFVSENTENKLTSDEIFTSIVDLINIK